MIIHVDMDAFYATVEIRDNPDLQGLPVIVGGSPRGRGVVSTANYVARKFGIHSAMPSTKAFQLCPDAVFIRPRMEHYVAISRQIREIFSRFTPEVEAIALDEAFLDVTASQNLFGPAESIARQIQSTIQKELELTASAGVAPNKFIAKVASDLQKPNGLVVVAEQQVQSFLDPLPIGRVWGIGPRTEQRFQALGVSTVAGIRQLSKDLLKQRFGLQGDHFWRLSRGLDSRPVVSEREAKTISHENTFPVDIRDPETLQAWVQELSGQVAMRLRRLKLTAKTVRIKIRFHDFQTISRSLTLRQHSDGTSELENAARGLLDQALQQRGAAVRLVGVGVTNLKTEGLVQMSLFDEDRLKRDSRIDDTCDQLKAKFGKSIVRTGAAIEQGIRVDRNAVTEDHRLDD